MSAPDQSWSYTARGDGDKHVVALAGELDMTVADTLHELLATTVGQATTVEVDLGGVTFIDSSVLNVLVTANNMARAARHAFTITNPRDQVRRVLDVTGVLATLSSETTGDRE